MKKILLLFTLSFIFINIHAQTGALIPDNIITPSCAGTPPSTTFSIKQLAVSNASDMVYAVATPLIGDIDNDGIVEIVVLAGVYPNNYTTNLIRIFEVVNNQITLQQTLSIPYVNGIFAAPLSIAKVDGNDYAAIFICTSEVNNTTANKRKLVKYTYNGSSYVQSGSIQYSSISNKSGGMPMIADFNGDGIPEVVVYDKIFNARTMTLLADGGLLSNASMGFGTGAFPNNKNGFVYGTYMSVADMDGDGVPEVVGGNCAYKVNIINPNGTAGNSFSLWNKCDGKGPGGESHGEVADGCTAVADMDGDGQLEAIVTVTAARNTLSTTKGSFYIWNPRTGKILHTNSINNISSGTDKTVGPSVPFIGDIDNDNEPEICFTSYNQMYAFEYDKSSKILSNKWTKTTVDGSACTTMSMFDFNQDGYTELIYRDETLLRIINGVTGNNIQTFPVKSGTGNEYPVVADVNNDGSAEIIVVGCTSGYQYGRLWIYTSNPAGMWAPARKVWNQFAYNAVNINNDLTVPKVMFNPATAFSGGNCGTVHPFNSYLQQQTTLDNHGCPVFLLPNVYPDIPTYTFNTTTKELVVSVDIYNNGDAALISPYNISFYKDSISSSNLLGSVSNNTNLQPNTSKTITFTKTLTDSDLPIDDIIVRVNDNGTTYPIRTECNTTDSVSNKEITRYTITCNWGMGTGTNPADYNALDLTIALNNPTTPIGYTFTGWTGSNGTTPNSSVVISAGTTGDLTYTANYTINKYTVTYDLNGGLVTAPTDTMHNWNTSVTILDTLPGTYMTEAVFLGWSFKQITTPNPITAASDTVGKIFKPAGSTFIINQDTTLYAVWAEDKNGPNGIPDSIPDYLQIKLIYNENQRTGSQSISGTLPPTTMHTKNTSATVSGNTGNLQRNPADSLILIGWSKAVQDNKDVKIAADKPADLILCGITISVAETDINLYAVWAYDGNGNGIPDCDEPNTTITPEHEWPETEPDTPTWNYQYDRDNANSWYSGCEMTLTTTISPDPNNERTININYLGALKKGFIVDEDGEVLADSYTLAKGDSVFTLHFSIVEDSITSANEGQSGAIETEIVGGGRDTSAWFNLYAHPSYDIVLVKPLIRSNKTVDFGITGGTPNLMRSINGGVWHNAYSALTSAEQLSVTDGASIWLREPNGCWEAEFMFMTYTDPIVLRYVDLPSTEGVTTNPGVGKHYVEGHQDFTFTASYAGGSPLKVMAKGYYTGTYEELIGQNMDDGTYKYTIIQVTEPWNVTFGPDLASSIVSNDLIDNTFVWSYGNTLYIRAEAKSTAYIYNISGTLYKQLTLTNGYAKERMKQGIYIIVIRNARYKVIVK